MKVFLAGDICPTTLNESYYKAMDAQTLFGDVADVMAQSDVSVINLECALGEAGAPIPKFGPNLRGCKETAQTLKKAGVTLCGISNNHFFDFGKAAALDTLELLHAAGLDTLGFGENYEDSRKNYIVEKDGQKICFFAVCEHEYSYALPDRMGCRPYDPYDTIWDIREAKKENDRVIVLYHGGKEHCRYPSPRLRQAFRAMAKNGADVIVGQHSHCISCYEEYEGSHLLYGQGNFNFLFGDDPECWFTAMELIYDTKTNAVTFIPTVQKIENGSVRLAQGAEKEEIMAGFEARNQSLADGTWLDGWRAFVESVKPAYWDTIARACVPEATERANAVFGHYLDCEAHHDVWVELFPTYNQTNEK